MSDKSCWLIERGQAVGHEPTLWWADSRYPDSELGRWTRIATDAMRFPTMETARHYADIYAGPHCAVTEHVFLDRESVPVDVIGLVVDEFLRWPLPRSVCSDPCASTKNYPNRTGTTLLTADEARQMFEYLIGKLPRANSRIERAATEACYKRADQAERAHAAAIEEIERLNAELVRLDKLTQCYRLDELVLKNGELTRCVEQAERRAERLKGHAEAMYQWMDERDGECLFYLPNCAKAYRADKGE